MRATVSVRYAKAKASQYAPTAAAATIAARTTVVSRKYGVIFMHDIVLPNGEGTVNPASLNKGVGAFAS